MSLPDAVPLLVVLSSLAAGVVIFLLAEEQTRTRTTLNLGAAVIKLALTGYLGWSVIQGRQHETRIPFLPDADLLLRADAFGLLFVTLSALLWLVTTIYAVGYLEGEPHRSRFFGFFSISVAATMGIALAGNLLTFLVFYEMLTLATWPLVVHRGTKEALRAGDRYLAYTFFGGTLLFAAVGTLYALIGAVDFAERGSLASSLPQHRTLLIVLFGLLITGQIGRAHV